VLAGSLNLLQGQGVEAVEDPPEGVVRGDAVGQFQEASEPIFATTGKGGDVVPGVRPADDGTESHGEDVEEQVAFAAVKARVLETAKRLVEGKRGKSHGSPP